MKKIIALIPIIIFVFNYCAATNMTSVKDPEFRNKTYSRFLIMSTFSDLRYKKELENSFMRSLQLKNITASTGLELLPPTRTYSDEEIQKILKSYGIDGILIVALQDYWESQYYIPKSTRIQGSASIVGNTITYSQQKQNFGGFNYSKPRVVFETRLIDSETGRVAWKSSSLTRGNAFAHFSTLANSLARETVASLADNGMVQLRYLSRSNTSESAEQYFSPSVIKKEIKEAETLFRSGEHDLVIQKLPLLIKYLEQSTRDEEKSGQLIRANLLLGSSYYKNQFIKVSNAIFKKVLDLSPDISIDADYFGEDVHQAFRKIITEKEFENKEVIKRTPLKDTHVMVVKEGAVLRVKPDENSTIVRQLPIGASLKAEEIVDDWIKIQLPPNQDGIVIKGYIKKSFVEIEKNLSESED